MVILVVVVGNIDIGGGGGDIDIGGDGGGSG